MELRPNIEITKCKNGYVLKWDHTEFVHNPKATGLEARGTEVIQFKDQLLERVGELIT